MNLAFEVFSISPTVSPAVVLQHNITLSLVVMLKNLMKVSAYFKALRVAAAFFDTALGLMVMG